LVNNAQIVHGPAPIEGWTEPQIRACWESGPLASWHFMVASFPFMKLEGGRVINLCSAAGHGRKLLFVGYSMAKEAIRSLTRCAAREWGQYKITVNAVAPMAASALSDRMFSSEAEQNAMFDEIGVALRQWGDAELDVGRAVVYLAGPDGRHVTGCTL